MVVVVTYCLMASQTFSIGDQSGENASRAISITIGDFVLNYGNHLNFENTENKKESDVCYRTRAVSKLLRANSS
ncbi:hypothetical protein TNIN_174451 [Trichonephila inaurata madagascariensis]|uniref:Uncharacterized protein n=1 Tax=Trichonephila inaurata madagascariensis TaxID=2747483 RepID=A0A8X6YPM8_9ARAC|nr:hypothetical protein TNIN_174451 [Trichonephila inaurata madagascariensis]